MTRVRFPDDPTAFDSPRNFRSTSDEQPLTANQWIELLRQLSELVPED